MRYALLQIAELIQVSEGTAIRQDTFKLIGTYPTIEEADNARDKFYDKTLYLITEVW